MSKRRTPLMITARQLLASRSVVVALLKRGMDDRAVLQAFDVYDADRKSFWAELERATALTTVELANVLDAVVAREPQTNGG